jgi:DNA-binding LacI/PurR family transcriptional regulator
MSTLGRIRNWAACLSRPRTNTPFHYLIDYLGRLGDFVAPWFGRVNRNCKKIVNKTCARYEYERVATPALAVAHSRMPRKKFDLPANTTERAAVSLKTLARHLDLSTATVSVVLNGARGSAAIPQSTKDRVFAAAEKLKYRPHFVARSLRKQRTFTIGVVVPEVSEGYAALVMSGIENQLLRSGYFYFVASHRHQADLLRECATSLLGRSVDGLIAVDTQWRHKVPIPVISVSGHEEVEGVTNILLDHSAATSVAIEHLLGLGHRNIACIKGQAFSSDTEVRWQSVQNACNKWNVAFDHDLTAQLTGDSSSPEMGYAATRSIISTGKPFTALFAFNDISAIGAIRALREAGLRVPEDVSVVGFDDILSAAFQNPSLTTVRQPLLKMGEIAAELVVRRIEDASKNEQTEAIVLQPKLVVRESTGPVRLKL